jgi:hypothetical protein
MVDRLLAHPKDIINISLWFDLKGFQVVILCCIFLMFSKTTNFWPELEKSTDAYTRYDASFKQKLPVKGLEIFLNMNNINEAIDVNRLRGFNRADPTFTNEMYEDVTSMAQNSSIDNTLNSIPISSRAKSLEQHYGTTIDVGFRYNF